MAVVGKIESFRDLKVWQRGMEAADLILEVCETDPLHRKLRFASQFDAAAVSIPSNIAEGHAGGSTKVYIKHLFITRGSIAECLTLLELAARRKYLSRPRIKSIWKVLNETGRLLNALINALERRVKGKKTRAGST